MTNLEQKIMEEYKVKSMNDLTNWEYISEHQKLSEEFITKYSDKVDWYYISSNQKLSEEFITKYSDKVSWVCISKYQKLSEEFISKYENKVNWNNISEHQKLDKLKSKLNKEQKKIQEINFKEKSLKEKKEEMKAYAEKWGLEYDGKILVAYRNHDMHGRGVWNKTISYEKGKEYKDWRCNMNEGEENSFGLGIFPKGNTKVRVKVEDWGVSVGRKDGKARVFGFSL